MKCFLHGGAKVTYSEEKAELYFGCGGASWLSTAMDRKLKIKSTRVLESKLPAAADSK
jgi:hypothetical protein